MSLTKHRHTFLFLLLIVSYQRAHAQFKTAFEIQNEDIKTVWFQADQVSTIQVKTHNASQFIFSSSSESTYKNDLYFDYHIKNDSLIIKSIFPEALEFGDNKMTSMQEFSVSVNFVLPHQSKLIIDSDIISVIAKGQFENFQLNTKSGNCRLNQFLGNADVNTYSGNITIYTRYASVNAFSRNGKSQIDRFYTKSYQMNLKSVNGDIIVRQME
ncbi:DUF4097 family beta strand repeat-containing protein [Mesohalobacter halotolerans]|uniref:Adhesin domain-containing protein n=1 Tax=Mesohalobacter halotolerans TaxID=1883405 RepID=A0A4U5TUC9_9FLAO|nr:hypothetical protein [Mesohalobacter halotolerans]MBS3739559.1 hypothetical protein [Psychroflexus sp.]TKS57114.1 hypothetical protein FCN74_01470 [Mesohalobacter halotolerans]